MNFISAQPQLFREINHASSLSNANETPENIRASVIRTARKILSGMVYLPE
jgi:2-methylaconitate cis-trans-isomerase PrpF